MTAPDRGLVTKRCVCGHGQDAHEMNMATHSCSGRCLRGHYAMNGNYVGGGCGCPKYTKEHVLVPDPALEVALSTSSPSSEHERSSRTDVGVEAGQLELKMDAT